MSKEQTVIKTDPSPPGTVVYVGRLPHGFYECELKEYFSQFGMIERLKVARNSQTHASKHFALIQFTDPEVARIVVETMHNYLLFGHLLQVKLYDSEKTQKKGFWRGANRYYTRKIVDKYLIKKKRANIRQKQEDSKTPEEKQLKATKRFETIKQKFDIDPLKCHMTMEQLSNEIKSHMNKS